MSDVAIFHAELTSAAAALQTASSELVTANAELYGDDVGVEDPAGRLALRMEFRRRLTSLNATVLDRVVAGSAVAADLTAISDRFTDLDVELTGRESP